MILKASVSVLEKKCGIVLARLGRNLKGLYNEKPSFPSIFW